MVTNFDGRTAHRFRCTSVLSIHIIQLYYSIIIIIIIIVVSVSTHAVAVSLAWTRM